MVQAVDPAHQEFPVGIAPNRPRAGRAWRPYLNGGTAKTYASRSARDVVKVLRRRSSQFGKHFVNVPRSVPKPVKSSAASEKESGAAAAIHLLGMAGEIAECDPGMTFRIRDRQHSTPSVDCDVVAIVREGEQPRITIDELGRVAEVLADLAAGLSGFERAEEHDQFVTGEARWIDL